jgi:short-subunit dehydrogenase
MIIWITGASTGIGREVARQYTRDGHTVCVSARGVDGLNALADECADAKGSIHAYELDVTDTQRPEVVFDAILGDVGLPDLVILNAGTSAPDTVTRFDRELYARIMDVNYLGVINCLHAVLPAYLQRRRGRIAVVASVAGYRGLPLAAAYCASKSALITLCESLQPELVGQGISLHVVDPGFIRTPLTDKNRFPMPFLMEVEPAAARLIAGLEQGRFEITFPKRFTWMVKTLRYLPFPLYLRLTRLLVRSG